MLLEMNDRKLKELGVESLNERRLILDAIIPMSSHLDDKRPDGNNIVASSRSKILEEVKRDKTCGVLGPADAGHISSHSNTGRAPEAGDEIFPGASELVGGLLLKTRKARSKLRGAMEASTKVLSSTLQCEGCKLGTRCTGCATGMLREKHVGTDGNFPGIK
jgi:hypothetical protein